jgi:hypothetical protein
MSDPQDLLYTNQFLSNEILTEQNLVDESKYYDRFVKYFTETQKDETEKYIENDLTEDDSINVKKTSDKKWPINSNRNRYPLFDTFTNDISSNRYKKEIITKLNIDSKNRDITKYYYPNSFSIPFNKTFNNIKKIVMNDIIFRNFQKSITKEYNVIAWQYVSQTYLLNTNLDRSIIPIPDQAKSISYSALPYAVFSTNITSNNNNNNEFDNDLVYQIPISTGYYTVNQLLSEIRIKTGSVLHGINPNSNNSNVVEGPYNSFKDRIGTPHIFQYDINVNTNKIKFVNRMEELQIMAIQTFSPYENNYSTTDIFYNYYNDKTLDNNAIYITFQETQDITDQYYDSATSLLTPSAFPLVITGLDPSKTTGNINNNLIMFTEFYDLNIYTNNGYSESDLSSISYYKFNQYITIPTKSDGSANIRYLRFAFYLSTGNVSGQNYNSNGTRIKPSVTHNFVYNYTLNIFLQNTILNSSSLFIIYSYDQSFIPVIGRALLFRWIFDIDGGLYVNYELNNNNEKKRSLLHKLAWPIANKTDQLLLITQNNGYRFVHSNSQSLVISSNDILSSTSSSTIQNQFRYNDTPLSLNLTLGPNGESYLVNNSYIFIKFIFQTNDIIVPDDNVVNAIDNIKLQYNQNYSNPYFFNVGIGEDYTCIDGYKELQIYKKDQTGIFCKILLDNIPGNYGTAVSNIIYNNNFSVNYNNVIDNISSLGIEVYDSDLRLLDISNNFSFTLNIHEIKDVLKETLINTKTNNVNSQGHFI